MMTGKDDRAAAALAAIDERIAWVLESPGMSVWLKSALKSALAENPITLSNDLEILTHLIVPRLNALLRQPLGDGGLSSR